MSALSLTVVPGPRPKFDGEPGYRIDDYIEDVENYVLLDMCMMEENKEWENTRYPEYLSWVFL